MHIIYIQLYGDIYALVIDIAMPSDAKKEYAS